MTSKVTIVIETDDQLVTRVSKLEEKVMALQSLLERLDAATSQVAEQLRKLKEQIAGGTVTPEQLQQLDATIAQLEQMGKDEEDPFPEV
jgi:predicted RNase H-like nuclease (RuvC/YqgF family)